MKRFLVVVLVLIALVGLSEANRERNERKDRAWDAQLAAYHSYQKTRMIGFLITRPWVVVTVQPGWGEASCLAAAGWDQSTENISQDVLIKAFWKVNDRVRPSRILRPGDKVRVFMTIDEDGFLKRS